MIDRVEVGMSIVIAVGRPALTVTVRALATKDLDIFAGIVVTALFPLTGAPALFLAWRAIKLRVALALAIAFPAALTVLFIGVVIAFA